MWEKIGYHWMWQKYSHIWYWYYPMWQWNCEMWKNNNGITKCDKNTIISEVSISQCDNWIVKCEKKNRVLSNDKSTVKCDVGTA